MRTHRPDARHRRPLSSTSFGLALSLAFALTLISTSPAAAQRPAGKAPKSSAPKAPGGRTPAVARPSATPRPADEAPRSADAGAAAPGLARYVPHDGLILYLESTGLEQHEDAWKRTAAYQLLNGTTVGRVLEDCVVDFLRTQYNEAGGSPFSTVEMRTLFEHVARNGFVLALAIPSPKTISFPLVLRGAGREGVRSLIERSLGPAGGKAPPTTVVEGRKVATVKGRLHPWCWWFEGEDLVLELGSGEPAPILEALGGKRPNASAHSLHAALFEIEDGFEPTGLAFLDMAALRAKLPPQSAPKVAALGLTDLKHVDYRWGFQEDALMGVLRVAAPAPRKGMLALFDGAVFDAKGVTALPPGISGFTATTVDLGKLYDRVVALAKAVEPGMEVKVPVAEAAVREMLGGVRLREDVLAHLGPKTTFYTHKREDDRNAPNRFGGPFGGPAAGADELPEIIFSTQVGNAATFGRTVDKLMTAANKALKASPAGRDEDDPRRGGGSQSLEFKKAAGRGTSYTLEGAGAGGKPGSLVPPKLTVTLGKNHLVIASTPEAAQLAVAVESRGGWVPGRDFKALAEQLPKRMAVLVVTDPRESVPSLVAEIPALVQLLNNPSSADNRGGAPGFPGGRDRMAGMRPGGYPPGMAPPGSSPSLTPMPVIGPSMTPPPGVGPGPITSPHAPGSQGRAGGSRAGRPGPEPTSKPGGGEPADEEPPKPAAVRVPIQVDPVTLPRAEDLRKRLFPGTIALTVDPREIRVVARASVPTLPGGAAVGEAGLGLILPAVQSAREASRRTACTNNLKQIGLALHNFAADNPRLPPAATADAEGKPLLSWRVAILPYLGESALYNQFKQDEPWDGPSNSKLIAAMPKAFACPSAPSSAPAGSTTYRAVVGKGAGFEGTKGLTLKDFTDGTANTLLVVEAAEAVPWTKPDELPAAADPARPLPGFGAPHAGTRGAVAGANALFADGSVRFLPGNLDPRTLNALTTRDGGEPLDPSSF